MKYLKNFLLIIAIIGISLPTPAQNTHPIIQDLRSNDTKTRQLAAQRITNLGLSVPLKHPKRRSAALMLFEIWRIETDAQTKTRLALMIIKLGFLVERFTKLETLSGEKPEHTMDERLIGPFKPKNDQMSPKTNSGKPADKPEPPDESKPPDEPEPPDEPKPETAKREPQPPAFANIYPGLTPNPRIHELAAAADRESDKFPNFPLPYIPRMNSMHDNTPGSLDYDIYNTCATDLDCLQQCPFGAVCEPCDPTERHRLEAMREYMRKNPNAIVSGFTSLLAPLNLVGAVSDIKDFIISQPSKTQKTTIRFKPE